MLPEDSAQVVGAKIFDFFCLENGWFNNFVPGIKLGLGFLDATLSGPIDHDARKQSQLALKEMLEKGTDCGQLLGWVKAHYQ